MKKLCLLLTLVMALLFVNAQDNVVKLGLDGLANGKINLEYERVIMEHQSANIRASIYIPRSYPYGLESNLGYAIVDDRITGFAINPEYRFYGKKHDAPEGFYTGVGFNYGQYSLNGDYMHNGALTENKVKLSFLGAGIQFGYQWVFNDMITVDWAFFGTRLNRITLSGESSTDTPGSIDYIGVRDDILEFQNSYTFLARNVDVEAGDDYLDISTHTFLPYPTMKLSIGFKF